MKLISYIEATCEENELERMTKKMDTSQHFSPLSSCFQDIELLNSMVPVGGGNVN